MPKVLEMEKVLEGSKKPQYLILEVLDPLYPSCVLCIFFLHTFFSTSLEAQKKRQRWHIFLLELRCVVKAVLRTS